MAQEPFGNQVNIPRFEVPKLPPGLLKWVILAVVVVAVLSTMFYQVESDEEGVVLLRLTVDARGNLCAV